jgi:phosphofructokinase-like protein
MRARLGRLGILTGGGDAPGLNAVIRAVVKTAAPRGIACVGLADGFEGLLHPERARVLAWQDVTGIHRLGGTILGTTNRGAPHVRAGTTDAGGRAYLRRCVDGFLRLDLQGLIVVGGDGTLTIADALYGEGVPVVGVPKTIDNDISETDMTFGFDSAVTFATEAIDRLHVTAEAHHRVMVVEVMGRYAGWIALHAAIAGGADIVLIPEIPFSFDRIADRVRDRDRAGARCTIVVAAEGAYPARGSRSVAVTGAPGRDERLGGIAAAVAQAVEQRTQHETRYDVLGHLQRGGSPTGADRVLATRFGALSVELAHAGKFGVMAALRSSALIPVPLARVAGRTRLVPVDGELVRTARAIGMSFGD